MSKNYSSIFLHIHKHIYIQLDKTKKFRFKVIIIPLCNFYALGDLPQSRILVSLSS